MGRGAPERAHRRCQPESGCCAHETCTKRLQRALCRGSCEKLAHVWATCALRHGCFLAAVRGPEAGGATAQNCSLVTYTAMLPLLTPETLQPHARVLLDAACCCAAHPTPETIGLAAHAVGAVLCLLRLSLSSAPAPVAPSVIPPETLAQIVWRASALLHSDVVQLYRLGTRLLTTVIRIRPLSDEALRDALAISIFPR